LEGFHAIIVPDPFGFANTQTHAFICFNFYMSELSDTNETKVLNDQVD
jgi:hypothetical protein